MYARIISSLLLLVAGFSTGFAQSWPVKLTMDNGDQVKIYEPKPEKFENSQLQFQSAVALQRKDSDMPVFGNMWAVARTQTSGSSQSLASLSVTGMRFPAEVDESNTRQIQSFIESTLPGANATVKTASIQSALSLNEQKKQIDADFDNKPPKLYYRNKPSMLVMIDGEPSFKRNDDWGMDAVVNSPNTIVRYGSSQFYLYGGKHWYAARAVGGPYSLDNNPPAALSKVAASLEKNDDKNDNNKSTDYASEFDDSNQPVSEVLVSYEPAELIQSNGEASFRPIDNTNLLYVENSPNDIFMDIASQQYFVLVSGRWYKSSSLSGTWNYTAADKLPADFAKIPAGSAKDNVLASVAGTPAAENAIMDAQLPQTARVERDAQPNQVTYDGTPEFQKINGTKMAYAINSSSTVIKYRNSFFLVENGVWFQSGNPAGPWAVSMVRPDEVDLIPPNSPVYNVKYVYVYDYTPDYVYVGYTPGYLNTFIYGPTVVYGTGWYYRPWWGAYYFPRPYTWGFNMQYNPWWGWSIGFNYSAGWFNYGWGYRPWNWWSGGWWGPSMYRPAYCWTPYNHYGYYGYRNNHFYVNNYYYRAGYQNRYGYNPNNVYRSNNRVYSRDVARYAPVSRPNRTPGGDYGVNRPYNNRQGTGFNRDNNTGAGNRGDIRRPDGQRMTDTRSRNERFNNSNLSRPGNDRATGDVNRPMTDTRPPADRVNPGNRVTPNPGFSARESTPQRSYQPSQRADISRPQGADRTQQLNRQPSFERRDMPQQRQQVQERPQFQQRSFERRDMPQVQQRQAPQMQQRSAPQMQQRSAPQMQRSAPSGGGSFNRGGGGGGGVSRPSRHH